ncbi:unnamed protein product [Ectocarpus sp. 4 AP-2014]
MRAATATAALLGCAAIVPTAAFTGGVGLARAAGGRDRRAASSTAGVRMMAIDPATVHSIGEHVNAVGSAGLDHTWLSHVMHGLSDAAAVPLEAVEEEAKGPNPFNLWIEFIRSSVLGINDFYKGIGIEQSFGLAIVTFTLGVKTLLVPLQAIQLQSSEKMQVLQPTVKEINAKFGQNKEAATAATNRLYAETKVNPLIGCLPALLQFPVFIGLYRAIIGFGTDAVANEGFLWLPSLQGPTFENGRGIGWLTTFVDGHPILGWHDTLCYMSIPAILVLSQKLSMTLLTPPDDGPDDATGSSLKTVITYLPVLIGWFSLNVPSALGIYWLANNLSTTATSFAIKAFFKMNPPEMNIPSDILDSPTADYALPTVAEALEDAKVNAWPDRRSRRYA